MKNISPDHPIAETEEKIKLPFRVTALQVVNREFCRRTQGPLILGWGWEEAFQRQ